MTELSGWGRHPRVSCDEVWANAEGDVPGLFDARGTIGRGLGRSYGDAATNRNGRVLNLTGLKGIRSFDEQTGLLDCGAGVTLDDILRDYAPRGWLPMITPGTKYVTVGGCIANDVHGKAHHAQGSFERSVESFRILLADGSIVETSRHERPELFAACFGGMGLLGEIGRAHV